MVQLNKIYNEDCVSLMHKMIDKHIKCDLVLTSPPYNMTSRKGGYADTGRYDVYEDWKSEEDYIGWTIHIFDLFEKILNENRGILYNFSYSIENPSLPYKLVSAIEQKTDFTLIDTIIWKKKCRNWEFVWVFVRKDEVNSYDNNRRIKSVSEKTGQKYYEAIYNFVDAANNDGKCPYNQATYSSELCDKLLDIYCQDGWTVYDPFIGSGTTAVSCVKRGLNYIGSEISGQQCKFAEERINNL